MELSDEQLVKNSLLFISVRENKLFVEKLMKVRRCLDQGADINASDGNDSGNTPLHMAARHGEDALVRLLINKGADVTRKNWNGQTPLEFAQALKSDIEIVNLLQITSSSASNNTKPEISYVERAGTLGGSDQRLYEMKLFSLMFLRALIDDEIEDFVLGTEKYYIGDICLRYRVKGQDKPVILFMQLQFKEGKLKKFSESIMVDRDHLQMYFQRYCRIKDQFQRSLIMGVKDPMFEGEFDNVECNLVFYTTATYCSIKKNTERQVSQKVHHLINTGYEPKVFQYDYDEYDIEYFTKILVIERLKNLGAVFLQMILSDKNTSIILSNKLIATYHVVMGQEVLQLCKIQQVDKDYRMWEFRPQFFESNSEYLLALKKTFVNELSTKRYDRSKITNEDQDNIKLILKYPCAATISKVIGKLVIYNHSTAKLQLIDTVAYRKKLGNEEFEVIFKLFNEIKINENVISEAIQIKLASMNIKLPLSFGNIDMTFRGNDDKVQKRIKILADKLIRIFEINKDTQIVNINEGDVGPGKIMEHGYISINGGIGGAVGNLLVLDSDTKMLKLDLDNKTLPVNAALFLKELKHDRFKPFNETLKNYRININIDGFPEYFLSCNEYDKSVARDFFNKLWFYTNQAKLERVEYMIKSNVNKFYDISAEKHNLFKFKIHPDVISVRFHDEMLKWWTITRHASYPSYYPSLHYERCYLNRSSIIISPETTDFTLNESGFGNLYESKLLCLIYLRKLKDEQIEKLQFRNNIREISDMDDIYLQYSVRGRQRPIILFLQVKKTNYHDKKIFTVQDVLSTSGEFSLLKLFDSYLTIKDRFQIDNKDSIFKGDFDDFDHNFVIYTSSKDAFIKNKVEHEVSEKVEYLINTGRNTAIFQYDYDKLEIDYLSEMAITEELRIFGEVFLKFILSQKYHPEQILTSKLIARYSVLMAREVLQQCGTHSENKKYRMWEFKPSFFESDCKYLTILRRTFVKELSTQRCDHSQITYEDRENFELCSQNPCAALISKLIGKLATYNDKKEILEIVNVKSFRNLFEADNNEDLLTVFRYISIDHNVISEAVKIKLATMKIKLPIIFGNPDMTFRGTEVKVQRRMKFLAYKLLNLLECNEDTMILEINDVDVGPGKMIERGFIDIIGGIGSAVGNLLVFDPVSKMLKFDLDNEVLPDNAALFLKELRDTRHRPINERLSSYRIRINIRSFPKSSFIDDEYFKKEASKFLSKVWFYTKQAKENDLNRIVQKEFNTFFL